MGWDLRAAIGVIAAVTFASIATEIFAVAGPDAEIAVRDGILAVDGVASAASSAALLDAAARNCARRDF